MRITRLPLPMLALLLIGILPLTACNPPPIQVAPAAPIAPPKQVIPAYLTQCPPMPSWYPQATCKPAPGQPATR